MSYGSRYDFGPAAARYEHWYDTAQGQAHDAAQRTALRGLLTRLPPPGRRALDVGCGTGHWSAFLAAEGFAVVGLDVSPAMIAAARQRCGERCRFVVADICRPPLPMGSCDLVVAMAALEFMVDPSAALASMAAPAGDGGVVVIGTLNRLARLNRQRCRRRDSPYAAAGLLSPLDLRRLLRPWGPVQMASATPATNGRLPPVRLNGLWLRLGWSSAPFILAAVRVRADRTDAALERVRTHIAIMDQTR